MYDLDWFRFRIIIDLESDQKGIDMQFASELERRRFRLKMSKAEVAKRAGVSLPTVKRVLAGHEQRPGPATLQGIGRALGVTIKLSPTLSVEENGNPFEFRKQRAIAKAKRLVRMVQGTMGL